MAVCFENAMPISSTLIWCRMAVLSSSASYYLPQIQILREFTVFDPFEMNTNLRHIPPSYFRKERPSNGSV